MKSVGIWGDYSWGGDIVSWINCIYSEFLRVSAELFGDTAKP